jgi:hypothetical protein
VAWSLGLRLTLYGECQLDGAFPEPTQATLTLQRVGRRRFSVKGTLDGPAALGRRTADGVWLYPGPLELELEGGWALAADRDPTTPRSLLGKSLWTGALSHRGAPRGTLRLRFDLRHDLLALLRSLHR